MTMSTTAELLPDDLPAELAQMMRSAGLGAGGLYWKLGLRITDASPECVAGTMPVDGNTQPHGVLHGGASIAFAETLASTAAAMFAGSNRVAVGVEVNATHHRATRQGTVHGVARAIHLGTTLASYAVDVTDDRGQLLCTSRVTCMIRQAPHRQAG